MAKLQRQSAQTQPADTPYHKWTNGGDKVRILKFVTTRGKAYRGFTWPMSGVVRPEHWQAVGVCGHGLHGWAWGIGFGEGKSPRWQGKRWIVFEADPADIIRIGSKVKAKCGTVIYSGSFAGALALITKGQRNWLAMHAAYAPTDNRYRVAGPVAVANVPGAIAYSIGGGGAITTKSKSVATAYCGQFAVTLERESLAYTASIYSVALAAGETSAAIAAADCSIAIGMHGENLAEATGRERVSL